MLEIEDLRDTLNIKAEKQVEELTSEEILKLSEELDNLIFEFMFSE